MNLEEECNATIDFLRKTRKLNPHECLLVLTFLIDSFPREYAVVRKEK